MNVTSYIKSRIDIHTLKICVDFLQKCLPKLNEKLGTHSNVNPIKHVIAKRFYTNKTMDHTEIAYFPMQSFE